MNEEAQRQSKLFSAHYYAHGCGKPYIRNESWLAFFQNIADRIVSDVHPQTVLDAGCALGFLVEGFRKRRVEAWGVDISEYAISQVHESISSYCFLGSITEPFQRSYDLIISIEVLEHLPANQAELAVENLCRHSDDIIFSSSPYDYTEPTHVNVQPPEYWAELFAQQGFFRDINYDASFITPWAVRFRRSKHPFSKQVRDYERLIQSVSVDNSELRKIIGEHRSRELAFSQARITLDEFYQFRNSRVMGLTIQILKFKQKIFWKPGR